MSLSVFRLLLTPRPRLPPCLPQYGSIVVEAVGQELLVQRGDDGSFLSIEGL